MVKLNMNFKLKQLIKIKLTFLIIFLLALFIFPQISFAESFETELSQQTKAFAGEQGIGFDRPNDPRAIVAQVIKVFLSVIGILFLVYTVYAGYLIMFSAGDEEKINKGKSTLRTAIIGIFIVLSSYSIVYFVTEVVWEGSIYKGDAYIDFGTEAGTYDFCRDGRGDRISCGRR